MFNPIHSSLELKSGADLRTAFLKYVVQTELSRSPLGDFGRRVKELSMADTDNEVGETVLGDIGGWEDDGVVWPADPVRLIAAIMSGAWQCFTPDSEIAGERIGVCIHSYGYTLTVRGADEREQWGDEYYTSLPTSVELLRWSGLEQTEEPAERTETCARCAEDVPEDDIWDGLCSWCAQLTR